MKKIILMLIYYSGLWLVFRRLNRRRAIILMYHGVTRTNFAIWTQIPEANFKEQMSYLAENYQLLPLNELVEQLKKNKLPHNSVAVTFDDGYENNASIAFPLLKKYGVPATIFITTGFIEREELYSGFLWPDLVYILLNSCNLLALDLSDQGLEKFTLGTHDQIVFAANNICEYLKRIPDTEKQSIIKVIRERTGDLISDTDREVFAPMSWEQIIYIHRDRLCSIGAHTINHPILSCLDLEEAEREIVQSKIIIEKKLHSPIVAFAYPNGGPQDINDKIVNKVAENFTYALSTSTGFIDKEADLSALYRLGIGNDMPLWYFKLYLSGILFFFKKIIKKSFLITLKIKAIL